MIRYAGRVLPWALIVVSSLVIAGLMTLVGLWPWHMWPLQGTALGVLAGAVAWSMDERSAAVVDTLPRGLWWRTVARAAVVPIVVVVWCASVWVIRDRIPDHLPLFVLQGVVAATSAVAWTWWRRSAGVAEPGRRFAAIVVPAATLLALARPLDEHLPLFPVWPWDGWGLSYALWAASGVVSLVVAAGAGLQTPVLRELLDTTGE